MVTVHVIEAPVNGRVLFEARGYQSVRRGVTFIESGTAPSTERLALWISEPEPSSGPDVVVCVPLKRFADAEVRAAEVVAGWEQAWLLIESMPSAHREAARDDLRGAVAMALISAAITGIEDATLDDDLGF